MDPVYPVIFLIACLVSSIRLVANVIMDTLFSQEDVLSVMLITASLVLLITHARPVLDPILSIPMVSASSVNHLVFPVMLTVLARHVCLPSTIIPSLTVLVSPVRILTV